MKLKKNDLQELNKSGRDALTAKAEEVRSSLRVLRLEKTGSGKISRRSLAQLLTALKELK